MVLSGDDIQQRLENTDDPEIFKPDTWVGTGLKEASYALRVANNQLMIDGIFYEQDNPFPRTYIEISPGRIAVLSTVEELLMPNNLVGKIGIRLEYALKGLTGLMGIQVDPCYGQQRSGERLYIRVANLGNKPIKILPGAPVFTFELNEVTTHVDCSKFPKDHTWEVLKRGLTDQKDASWSYATSINDRSEEMDRKLREDAEERESQHRQRFELEIGRIRDYIQPVVMFGIFLLAVTILSVSVAAILNVRDAPPEITVPEWVKGWGWIVLLVTLSGATGATAVVAGLTCWQLVKVIWDKPAKSRRGGTYS